MVDQAEALRRIVLQASPDTNRPRRGQMVLVYGAEPAMGTSMLSLQLAIGWMRRDEPAALFDVSRHRLPLRSLRSAVARERLRHVISRDRTLREAWLTGPCGLPVAGGDFGDNRLEDHPPLLEQLRSAADQQHLVIDLQQLDDTQRLLPMADHCIFVTTAEEERLASTYCAIKRTIAQLHGARGWLAMSQTIDSVAACELQQRLVVACDRCLNLALKPLGCLPWDPNLGREDDVSLSVAATGRPSPYRQAVHRILGQLDGKRRSTSQNQPPPTFAR